MRHFYLKLMMLALVLLNAITSVKAQIEYADNQRDYVLNNKGDTIRCEIVKPVLGLGVLKYRPATDDKAIKLDPLNVKEYRIDNDEIFVSVRKRRREKPDFIRLLERGKINIYYEVVSYYSGFSSSSKTFWYCSKAPMDTVMELKTDNLFMSKSRESRQEDFGNMLKDNPAVYDKYIADDKFTFNQIRKLIHLYNTGREKYNKKDRGY